MGAIVVAALHPEASPLQSPALSPSQVQASLVTHPHNFHMLGDPLGDWKCHKEIGRTKNAERHSFGASDEPGLGQETTDPPCNWRLGEISGGRHGMQMGPSQAAGTSPEGPTVSARLNAKSPLPQHRSTATSPGRAPLHLMAMRFHTLCCPRLSMLFSCKTYSQYRLRRS